MTATLPANHVAAKRALAKAVRFDEVKDIRDKAVAMQVYAKQAKDGELIAYATDIRKRAERRLGELMEDERKTGKLAKGAREKGVGRRGTRVIKKPALSLADRGIDKNLADRARKMAALPEAKFEVVVAKATKIAVAAVEDDTSVIHAARAERLAAKRERREERERELGEKITALPNKRFGVIVADPEWHDKVWSEETGMDRHASNHYPTSDAAVIASRPVATIAARDCVLFMWTTNQHLRIAIGVLEAWGFEYKSNYCWGKNKISTGRWNRSKHELLLIGTRGKIPCPAPGTQWESLIMAPRGKHSEKPAIFLKMIEEYYPNIPKIELNARKRRKGWDAWGLEAPPDEAAE